MKRSVMTASAVGVILLGVGAYVLVQRYGNDPDLLPGTSPGMIAAEEILDRGSRIVILKEDGAVTEVPGYPEGKRDIEPSWRPDGGRLFFASDREANTFHIFRWRPDGGDPERRSIGSNSRSAPVFGFKDHPKANESALITARGQVLEYFPRDGKTFQVLPPAIGAVQTEEEGGNVDAFSAIYSRIGTSFKTAMWGKNREVVVAIMKREEGEVLMVQQLGLVEDKETGRKIPLPPRAVMAGASIQFDMDSQGRVIAAIQDFQWLDPTKIPEEFIEKGVAKKPFQNAMIFFDSNVFDKAPEIVFASDNENALGDPKISPTGDALAFTTGRFDYTNGYEPQGLVTGTFPPTQSAEIKPIAEGFVRDPAWFPKGDKLVFVRSEGGDRAVFVVSASGGDAKRISPEGRNFARPTVSPQTP